VPRQVRLRTDTLVSSPGRDLGGASPTRASARRRRRKRRWTCRRRDRSTVSAEQRRAGNAMMSARHSYVNCDTSAVAVRFDCRHGPTQPYMTSKKDKALDLQCVDIPNKNGTRMHAVARLNAKKGNRVTPGLQFWCGFVTVLVSPSVDAATVRFAVDVSQRNG
jgi:hypothetical protein